MGTLPVLNYNGQEIGQSLTITRFLAKKAGLAGRNELEEAKASMLVDHSVDLLNSKLYNLANLKLTLEKAIILPFRAVPLEIQP